jgi:YD repeat-containing protein
MEFTGTLDEWAAVTLGGNAASVDASNNWAGTAAVTTGANTIPLVATDASGNATSRTISVDVTGDAARALVYDRNGNLTDNGDGQTYSWDAANRLTKITYSDGSYSAFVYNGLGQRVEIVEKDSAGATTSDKYYVWAGGAQPVEERDASNTVTKRFYGLGEQIAGTYYYYTTDHLGSVREVTDANAAVVTRYTYDPYGRITKESVTVDATFGFTGFYRHRPSGLDMTLYRAYDP